MSIGVSIFLLVVGAILTFAVTVSASGFNINTVGIIHARRCAWIASLATILEQLLAVEPSQDRARVDTVIEERRIERDLP